MKIVPAILANTEEQLHHYVKVVEGFADYAHIDVADGDFVSNITAKPEHLRETAPAFEMEIHLMVKNPLDWVRWYQIDGVRKIIFHYESMDEVSSVIEEIRNCSLEPALALNPETKVTDVASYLERVEMVQVMTIHPGFQGNELEETNLQKVKELKLNFHDLPVSIDGGVNLTNIDQIKNFPVDQIVVGSAIVKADNPAQVYNELVTILDIKH